MKILELDQNTEEWLAWRSCGIGASDAAKLVNRSKYGNRDTLFREKLGRLKVEMNGAMWWGKQREPKARELYERRTGLRVRPVCCIHDHYPFLRASLDGLSEDNTRAIEIKCPRWELHAEALDGTIPRDFADQIQYQLLVTGLDDLDFVSYSDAKQFTGRRRLAVLPVTPDKAVQEELLYAAETFWFELQAEAKRCSA